MILSKKTVALWLLITLSLGLIGGYIFSSKFCSMSIAKRVEKISSLNQNMRRLFALRTFYNFLLMNSHNSAQKDALKEEIMRINKQISIAIGDYYDVTAQQNINNLLNAQLDARSPEQRADCDNKIAALLAELNPLWAASNNFIRANFTQSDQNSTDIKEALKNNDTQNAVALFESMFNDSLELSDEITRGITGKFSNKF